MNVARLALFLLVGTLAMLVPIQIQGAWYQIKWTKTVPAAVLLTISGTLGTFLLFYIENGEFGGTSFYGAVFFVPILFLAVARLLRVPYPQLMDLCAPAECVMLAIMKVQCYLTGCCGGAAIPVGGASFVFPSQLAELADALIICVILLLMSRRTGSRGKLYPRYMVLYGVTRFVLNIFRDTPFVSNLGMPFGNFWSLVSIAIGAVWLIALRVGEKDRACT